MKLWMFEEADGSVDVIASDTKAQACNRLSRELSLEQSHILATIVECDEVINIRSGFSISNRRDNQTTKIATSAALQTT